MTNRLRNLGTALLTAFIFNTSGVAQESSSGVRESEPPQSVEFAVSHGDGKVEISLAGQSVATYFYRHDQIKRPFFAHVKTPSGIQVTRNFPPVEGVDRADHPDMHPGVWMAFARLNDVSFWHNDGAVRHEGFAKEPVGGETASFVTSQRYVDPQGKLICRETTSYTFTRAPDGVLIDIDAMLSSNEPFYFGVREENGLGIRVATPLAVANGGSIVNSAGGRNEEGTWGKVAKWWDYAGEIDGRQVGLMIMSAPGNPEMWAHSRDYGLLVANPFPVDRPENRQRRFTVQPNESLQLRFGVLVHEHDADASFDREGAYRRYVEIVSNSQ